MDYERLYMPFSINREYCVGCMVCKSVCPTNAISVCVDQEGFQIPNWNPEACINCKACFSSCQSVNPLGNGESIINSESYIVRLKNERALLKSASGGAFYGIASYIIRKYDGVAIGAAWDEALGVSHICIERVEDLDRLQNSKYVQSNVDGIYSLVKEFLDNNRYVVFSGTPCQIAGLKKYLKKNYNRLILIDIVCHGVPSPSFLQSELKNIEESRSDKIKSIYFRVKGRQTRSNFMLKVHFENKRTRYYQKENSLYYILFLKGLSFRESCYSCNYASNTRFSDITIGDCDSYKSYPDFYPNTSNSICLLNSERARVLWSSGLKDIFYHIDLNVKEEAKCNSQLSAPHDRELLRDTIYRDLIDGNSDYLKHQYCTRISAVTGIKARLKTLVPSRLLSLIRR